MTAANPGLQLLGLAARAGAILPGTEQVVAGVRAGRVRYALVASDLTETGRNKVVPLLEREAVPYVMQFPRAELGRAVGRSPLAAVGVVDAGFGDRLQALFESGERDTQDNSK